MAKMYFRCFYSNCNEILLSADFAKEGVCQGCGGKKFRGFYVGEGKLSGEEEKLLSSGLAHTIETDTMGEEPDVLNAYNHTYWKRVKKEVGGFVAKTRKQIARDVLKAREAQKENKDEN